MAEATQIIRLVIDSSKAVEGSAAATRALEKLERSTASMDGALSRMERGLASVGGMVKAQLALMVAELGARFVQMGKDSLKAVAGLDDLAEQLGVTTKFLQASQFAAVQSGVKLEQLEAGYSKFSQKMGEAAEGSKEMVEALDKLGIKNLDVAGKLRPTEALMEDVARAIVSIEDPARRSAAAVDFFGKAGTRMLPMLKDIANGADSMAERAKAAGTMISEELIAKLKLMDDRAEVSSLRARALFAQLGAPIVTAALDAVNKVLESIADNLARLQRQAQTAPGRAAAADASNVNDQLEAARQAVARNPRDKMAASSLNALERRAAEATATANAQQAADAAALFYGDTPKYTAPAAPGAKLSGIKGAGQGEADKIAKLERDTGRELDAANAYAVVSAAGAKAVADLEIHFKALKAAQDAYGATADKNTGQVAALTAKIEEQLKLTERAKNLKDFNLGTVELEKANELLAAENGLINANVETRAIEIAQIKLKQELQAKGITADSEEGRRAIERRGIALETGERLKAQGEELRKANELWTAPLKSALESIHRTAADAFEGMLESGKFSFQALGDVVKKTVLRMIAEFAALAIVRPLLGSLMGGLTSVGLVSPSMASSLGYGGGSGGAGGAGGFSMPSMGGGSGMFGFLNNPIDPGSMPAGMYGPAQPGLGGLTWGGGIAGAAGIGMGAYQLATSKSTAGKIGGGLGMLGSGIGLASAAGLLPMLGTAGGPIGMGIGMLGMLLPSLLGGGESAPLPPLSGANTRFDPSAGGYAQSGSQQNGGGSINGQFAGVGSTLDSLFGAIGGLTDPSLAFGASVWNNQREGTTSTYLISPTQGSNQQTYNESGDPAKAIDRLIAKVFYDSVQNNAAMNASPTLRTALGNKETTSVAQVQALLSLVDAYDKLGKTSNSAKDALDQINAQFSSLTAGANEYGLSLAPINAEQKKLTTRYAQDFIDGMVDPMAAQMRALDDQRKDSLSSAEYIRDNVKDVAVDMVKITEYWNKKRLDLENQFNADRLAQAQNFQALIRRLTYGDLANASPDTSLSGTRGTYSATLAQARAGDANALNNLSGAAESYASSSRSYFASSAEYSAIRDQIIRDLEERAGAVGATTGGASSVGNNEATNAVLNSNAELRAMFQTVVNDNAELKNQVAALVAQLARGA